jgi:hypothetical protein
MLLTKELAEKYASYRTRYLFGTGGGYAPRADIPTDCLGGAAKGQPVPFLSFGDGDPSARGTFLNADKLFASGDLPPEVAEIEEINRGDNIIYVSYALLNFVAEYAITGQGESLAISQNIITSLVRLGTYHQGLNEETPPGGPHGWMLRHDSPDVAKEENICTWLGNPDDARDLEPSYDQYCALLSCLRLARRLLADVPRQADHEPARNAFELGCDERIKTVSNFLARCFWLIVSPAANGEPRMASRGAFCVQAAYPFARIAADTSGKPAKDYFIGFSLSRRFGLPDTDPLAQIRTRLTDALTTDMPNRAVQVVLENLLTTHVLDKVIGGKLDEVAKFLEGVDKVREQVSGKLRGIQQATKPVDDLAKSLISAIAAWAGGLEAEAAMQVCRLIHHYYSKWMLQNVQDALSLKLGEFLTLIGVPRPDSIGFEFDFVIKFEVGGAPSWWPKIWEWDGWSESFSQKVSVTIGLGPLWDLPCPVNLLDLIGLIASGVGGAGVSNKPDLRMLLFLSCTASNTFADTPFVIDPVATSARERNSLMMALSYRYYYERFVGDVNASARDRFVSVMGELAAAPDHNADSPPAASPWDQNFRWMRARDSGDAGRQLYSGVDFMLPLMLAASSPEFIGRNRKTLVDAMSAKFDQEDSMGLFRLPFQGPYAEAKTVFTPYVEGTSHDNTMYLGVVFERGRGPGKVVITYKDLNGNEQTIREPFLESEPARLVAVPMSTASGRAEIKMQVTTACKGYLLVQFAV